MNFIDTFLDDVKDTETKKQNKRTLVRSNKEIKQDLYIDQEQKLPVYWGCNPRKVQ